MNGEKATKELLVRVPPSLFAQFQTRCNQDYKTVSEVIRSLMADYVRRSSPKDITFHGSCQLKFRG